MAIFCKPFYNFIQLYFFITLINILNNMENSVTLGKLLSGLPSSQPFEVLDDTGEANLNLFTESAYLEKARHLIEKSLKEGYDIAQMPNGDIVKVGIKIDRQKFTWGQDEFAGEDA